MANPIGAITDAGSEILEDAKEVVKQRFFSPMYFYFILSWIITNWKFVYALVFVSSEDISIEKLDYLIEFYPIFWFCPWDWNLFGLTLLTVLKLILIPAFSTYFFVWWFSRFSEKFYERNEIFKQNIQAINRRLDYKEKVKIAKEQRRIRDEESDTSEIRYEDHDDFNQYINEGQENITLLGVDYLPSEALYNTDIEAYKAELNEYMSNREVDDL